jgi:hypothetical protein
MKTASALPELTFSNQNLPRIQPWAKPQGFAREGAMLMPLNYWLLAGLESSLRESLRTLARSMRRIPQRPLRLNIARLFASERRHTWQRHGGCPF